MGSQSTQLVESEIGSSSDKNTMSNSSAWAAAPGSPRFSFSRDLVQSEVFNPSTVSSTDSGDSDFDFGIFALLRADNPGSATPMLPAHQLIHNGKILLQDERVLQSDHTAEFRHDSPSKSRSHKLPKSTPPPPSRSWKDLFPLNFMRSSSASSSSSSSSSSSTSASPETVPLNATRSSFPAASLREKTSSKLRFLFRSSSAGSGTRDQSLEPEPSLGRSASESKVSCCSSCDPFQVPDRSAASEVLRHRGAIPGASPPALHRRTGSTADAFPGQIVSDTWKMPRERIRHRSFHGRPVLAEVKVGGAESPGNGSPNFQSFNNNSLSKNGLIHKNTTSGKQKCWNNNKKVASSSSSSSSRPGRNSSSNAWRAYMSNANRNTGNMKVAEVLHMEVCMGQSLSKAFSMRKENEIQPPKSSSSSNNNNNKSCRLPCRASCQSHQSLEQI